MYSTIFSRTQVARQIAAACGAGVLIFGITACGEDAGAASETVAAASGNGGSGADGDQQAERPGTSGLIAAVTADTAQVQSADSGQVAVSWTTDTTFTKQVSIAFADLSVGDCVLVTGESLDAAAEDAATAPSPSSEVSAASVRVTEPVDGACAAGGGGAAGGGRGGADGGSRPAPGDGNQGARPDGAGPGGGQFGGGRAVGTVMSLSANGFVLESVNPIPSTTDDAGEGETAEVVVTVAGTTTFSTTAVGAAGDVVVGQCLQADGTADDTGAIVASQIALTEATDGVCGAARGGRVGGAGGAGGNAPEVS